MRLVSGIFIRYSWELSLGTCDMPWYGGFLKWGVSPVHHPFIDGIVHHKPPSNWGFPMVFLCFSYGFPIPPLNVKMGRKPAPSLREGDQTSAPPRWPWSVKCSAGLRGLRIAPGPLAHEVCGEAARNQGSEVYDLDRFGGFHGHGATRSGYHHPGW